jgi:hypothetical protein
MDQCDSVLPGDRHTLWGIAMKYMLLIYGTETRWTDAERKECMDESLAICNQLAAQGKFIDAAPLQPVATAATLRFRDGRTLITDGPFAETVEQLGGYYVLDLADLDEALAVAASLPPVTKGTVEIRPMATLDGLPPAQPSAAAAGETAFLLLSYKDEATTAVMPPAAVEARKAEAVALARELDAAGVYLSAAPLYPGETATCVRVRDGKRAITDGPFAETNEVLGGYFLIRAADRAAALRVAARFAGPCGSAVEVRPLFDLSVLRNPAPSS